MIYKYITINSIFIFVFSISTWYTFYRDIKKLVNKHEIEHDWTYEKILCLEKEISNNKELIIALENRIKKQNELLNKLEVAYQENNINPFFSNSLRIINPNLFCENKSVYFNEICKSPYILENTISTSSTTSTNRKNLSPSEFDWTNVVIGNEYYV